MFAALCVAPVHSQPSSLGTPDKEWGYEWIAASRVLARDGSVSVSGPHERLRRALEWQIRHGSRAGAAGGASARECPPGAPRTISPGFVETEQDGRFISVLLLSGVAATATVAEAIPGFYGNGNPGMLLVLSDVAPLHARSTPIGHVLVPVKRLVARGRVFCWVFETGPTVPSESPPEVGDRIAILGEWSADDVLRARTMFRLGMLAVARPHGKLQWDDFRIEGFPLTMDDLHERVAEAYLGGLIDGTSHLRALPYGSRERAAFVEQWRQYEADGCRIVAVAERPGGGLLPSRKICPVGVHTQ